MTLRIWFTSFEPGFPCITCWSIGLPWLNPRRGCKSAIRVQTPCSVSSSDLLWTCKDLSITGPPRLSVAPELLAVQLARFDTRGRKRHDTIECQPVINVPIFTDLQQIETIACSYVLQAICVHQGCSIQQGHFRSLLYEGNLQPNERRAHQQIFLTDDGVSAIIPSKGQLKQFAKEVYIVFYVLQSAILVR